MGREAGGEGGFDIIIGNPPYVRQETLGEAFKGFVRGRYELYAGTADLYVYFIERAMQLLRPGGYFGFIVANKWMRAGYGQPLRRWLKGQHIVEIVDFGDLPVFQRATTYPCILILRKAPPAATFRATQVRSLEFGNLADLVREQGYEVSQAGLDDAGWSLSADRTQAVLDRMRARGVPLEEYVRGKIFRGVLTGLNEAFVIDQATRDHLIAQDPRSAELIKPFLIGRDVKRYAPLEPKRYLIFTRRGVPIDQYPAIKGYLAAFRRRLEPRPRDWPGSEWPGRKPGSYEWYEIQDTVDYYAEFDKPKIIAPAIVSEATFAYDETGLYSNDKTCIMRHEDPLYLLGFLNSALTTLWLRLKASTKQGGYFEQKPVYLAAIPVPRLDPTHPADVARHDRMVALVEQMLDLHKKLAATTVPADRALYERQMEATDRQIDALVYELYGLTDEEIAIVEAAGK